MENYIMKKALIQNIVLDNSNNIDYIEIFDANGNKTFKVYSEEMGSVNINNCRINSLVDYVEVSRELASFRLAIPIKRKIVISGLKKGTIDSCIVTDVKEWGAFVSIMGISCILRNCDFSDDSTAVKDIYKKGDIIHGIKFRKISSKDRISLELKEKYFNKHSLNKRNLKSGNIVLGLIRNIKEEQNRCFVGVSKGFDLLANIPVDQKIFEGQKVVCKITKVELDGYGVRGKIIKVI